MKREFTFDYGGSCRGRRHDDPCRLNFILKLIGFRRGYLRIAREIPKPKIYTATVVGEGLAPPVLVTINIASYCKQKRL